MQISFLLFSMLWSRPGLRYSPLLLPARQFRGCEERFESEKGHDRFHGSQVSKRLYLWAT